MRNDIFEKKTRMIDDDDRLHSILIIHECIWRHIYPSRLANTNASFSMGLYFKSKLTFESFDLEYLIHAHASKE